MDKGTIQLIATICIAIFTGVSAISVGVRATIAILDYKRKKKRDNADGSGNRESS